MLYQILRPVFTLIFKAVYNPRIINADYIPADGKCVIAGNHKHALDPIFVDVCTRRVVHTLAKKDLHDGAFGWFFRAIKSIPVDLHAEHNKDALESAIEELNKGELINLSPEAKRNYTEEILLPFKYGAVVMAKRTGSKIVPYSITGDYRFRSRNLTITFGKPLDVSSLTVEDGNRLLFDTIKNLLLRGRDHLDYPDVSLYELLRRSAASHPGYISYNYFGNRVSYRRFLKQIDGCASALVNIGVEKGDAVSICMPNTPEAIIAFYAINRIGAVANMIHPLSAQPEIKYYLNLCKSRYIITIDMALDKITAIEKDTSLKQIIVVSPADSMPFIVKTIYKISAGKKENSGANRLTVREDAQSGEACTMLSWKEFTSNNVQACDGSIPNNVPIGNGSISNNMCNAILPADTGRGSDTATILYSGGTTGYPKGIMLTNLNFNALAMQSFEACACLKAKDKVLAVMPVFHGFGLGICIHTVQYFGGTSILLPRFTADTFGKLILKYRPNIIAGVPTLYEALLQNKSLKKRKLSFLKCVISGGDSLSVSLKRRVDDFLREHGADIQIREGYGLTECVTGSCLTPEKYYREGSIGILYPDTCYKIVKPETIDELPYGEEGEIVLSGPSVMKGYVSAERDTAVQNGQESGSYLTPAADTSDIIKRHSDGKMWLHTGDIGCMDEDGFVYFKQRLKRIIVSSGYSIYPQYIENVIDSHEGVYASCVVGIDHPYKVQVAKAYIVPKDKSVMDDEEAGRALIDSLKEHCKKNLSRFSLPSEYELISELPRTLVGKIAYGELEKGGCRDE